MLVQPDPKLDSPSHDYQPATGVEIPSSDGFLIEDEGDTTKSDKDEPLMAEAIESGKQGLTSIKGPFDHASSISVTQERISAGLKEVLKPGLSSPHVFDRLVYQMHKFSLYETSARYYIVGVDVSDKHYRILKIDRTSESTELSMTDDRIVYSLAEKNQLLETIDHGNRGTGGIKFRSTTWGLLGFIKFTTFYYMLLITKKSKVAVVGGHYVYQIEGTELVPLTPTRPKSESRNPEEQRFLGILHNLDLTKSFYYSYSYDVTRTLQHNMASERASLAKGSPLPANNDFNSMFVWNDYLLQPAVKGLRDPFDWCRPIIHGYIDQAGESEPCR